MQLADTCKPEDHPSGQVLAEFFAGRLSSEETESVARHLETCPLCMSQTSIAAVRDDRFGGLVKEVVGAATEVASAPRHVVVRGTASPTPSRIDGFQIQEELGRGGMGRVFRAYDERLKRTVALKVLLAKHEGSSDIAQRFRNEAQAAARLTHEGIVPIYEVGEHEGAPYFTMPLAEGGTLSARLVVGPLPPREAAELVRQLAEAVGYAHEHKVVHRDLKPGNILFAQNRPQIADFGLAKLTDETFDLTMTGDVMGTPQYMAPEQTTGKKAAQQSPAVDLYALGAILYATLTGRPPFQAAALGDLLEAIRQTEPVSPRLLAPKTPRDLETICLKCLEKSPERRYATARDLADDMGRFLRDEPIRARRVTAWERASRWRRKNPLAANLSAVTVVCALTMTAAIMSAIVTRVNNVKIAESATALVLPLIGEDRYLSGSPEEQERLKRLRGCLDTLRSLDGAIGVGGQGRLQAQVKSRILLCDFALHGPQVKLSDLEDALHRLQAAYAASSNDEETISDLAEVQTRLGQVCAEWRNAEQADVCFRRAEELRKQLSARKESPYLFRYQRLYANARMNLGHLQEAQDAREALAKSAPPEEVRALYRDLILGCLALHDDAGGTHDRRLAEADEWFDKVGSTFDREFRYLKARLHVRRGCFFVSGSKPTKEALNQAVAEFKQAESLLKTLANDHPALAKYRAEAAKNHLYRGAAERQLSQFDDAFHALTAAMTEFHPLVLQHGDALFDLGATYMELLILTEGRTLNADQRNTFNLCEKNLIGVFDELGDSTSLAELRRIAKERGAAEGAGEPSP